MTYGVVKLPGEASIIYFRNGKYFADPVAGKVYRSTKTGNFSQLAEKRHFSDSNKRKACENAHGSKSYEDEDTTRCANGECFTGLFGAKLVSMQLTVGDVSQFPLSRCIWSARNPNTFPHLMTPQHGSHG